MDKSKEQRIEPSLEYYKLLSEELKQKNSDLFSETKELKQMLKNVDSALYDEQKKVEKLEEENKVLTDDIEFLDDYIEPTAENKVYFETIEAMIKFYKENKENNNALLDYDVNIEKTNRFTDTPHKRNRITIDIEFMNE